MLFGCSGEWLRVQLSLSMTSSLLVLSLQNGTNASQKQQCINPIILMWDYWNSSHGWLIFMWQGKTWDLRFVWQCSIVCCWFEWQQDCTDIKSPYRKHKTVCVHLSAGNWWVASFKRMAAIFPNAFLQHGGSWRLASALLCVSIH